MAEQLVRPAAEQPGPDSAGSEELPPADGWILLAQFGSGDGAGFIGAAAVRRTT
jgi:hypothetical protein